MKEVRPVAELIAEEQDAMVEREEQRIKNRLRSILESISLSQREIRDDQKRLAGFQKQLAEFTCENM